MGQYELEIDSRDFYVDNESIGNVVGELARCLPGARDEDNDSYHAAQNDHTVPINEEAQAAAWGAEKTVAADEKCSYVMQEAVSAECNDGYCKAPMTVLVSPPPQQQQPPVAMQMQEGLEFGGMPDVEDFEPEVFRSQ